jgi:orotidine-5'-phosphate decarboxylase
MVPEIIISCDVQDDVQLDLLVKETHDIPGVKGYKLGASLALFYGLKYLSSIILQYTGSKILMYDHQKAGMDFPFVGEKFMSSVRKSGMDSVIIFPIAGNEVQRSWTQSARDEGMVPILGAKMSQWTLTDIVDNRGRPLYWDVYDQCKKDNVNEFVVAATAGAADIINFLDNRGMIFYTPGIGAQGGTIAKLKEMEPMLGGIVPIIGRSIYESANMAQATKDFLSQMEGD